VIEPSFDSNSGQEGFNAHIPVAGGHFRMMDARWARGIDAQSATAPTVPDTSIYPSRVALLFLLATRVINQRIPYFGAGEGLSRLLPEPLSQTIEPIL
jgi:hypothetical protein